MRKAVVALIGALSVTGVLTPASAVRFDTAGADGDIAVEPNLAGCAWLDFGSQLFAGEFTAVGYMQGPGTRAATIERSIPVVTTGSWSDCIFGGYAGATYGEAKYTLNGVANGDTVTVVKECVVAMGSLTCV